GGAPMGGDGVEGLVQVLEFSLFRVRGDRGCPQVARRADHQPGAGQGGGGLGGQRAAVAADHGDRGAHALLAHEGASAILAWPVKSPRMTRIGGGCVSGPAASALNLLSTRAARAHSSPPASGSRPAWSQSSAACRAVLAAATCAARSWVPPAVC